MAGIMSGLRREARHYNSHANRDNNCRQKGRRNELASTRRCQQDPCLGQDELSAGGVGSATVQLGDEAAHEASQRTPHQAPEKGDGAAVQRADRQDLEDESGLPLLRAQPDREGSGVEATAARNEASPANVTLKILRPLKMIRETSDDGETGAPAQVQPIAPSSTERRCSIPIRGVSEVEGAVATEVFAS